MCDPNGISRGSGFVAFSTSEEASRAVSFFLSCLNSAYSIINNFPLLALMAEYIVYFSIYGCSS